MEQNNSLPIEVVEKILTHIEQKDLLQTRLVSQSWNRESLKVIKSITTVAIYLSFGKLDDRSLLKFLDTLSPYTSTPECILPFHLDFSTYLITDEMLEEVDRLQTIFGPTCIQSFELDDRARWIHDNEEYSVQVVKLFTKVASGLRSLDYLPTALEYLALDHLPFPSLTTLNLHCSSVTVVDRFLQRCPRLKSLSTYKFSLLLHKFPNVTHFSCTSPIGKLDNFFSNSIRDVQLRYYREGEFPISWPNSLQYLTIILNVSHNRYDSPPWFPPFPQLPNKTTSLEFHCGIFADSPVVIDPLDYNMTPENLPGLESIRNDITIEIQIRDGSERIVFPKVRQLTLYIPSSFQADYECSESFDLQVKPIIRRHLDVYLTMFPNIRKFSLSPDSEREDSEVIKVVLYSLLTSDLAPKLEYLELNNYKRDVFGEILGHIEMPPKITIHSTYRHLDVEDRIFKAMQILVGTSRIQVIDSKSANPDGLEERTVEFKAKYSQCVNAHKMINLKKIRIELGVKNGTRRGGSGDELEVLEQDRRRRWYPSIPLHLMTIAKSFPKLEEIEIVGGGRHVHLQELEQLAKEYPNLAVTISHG